MQQIRQAPKWLGQNDAHSQAPELRELARQIRELVQASQAMSTASEVMEPACRMLELQAFYFETLHREHAREQELVGYGGDAT